MKEWVIVLVLGAVIAPLTPTDTENFKLINYPDFLAGLERLRNSSLYGSLVRIDDAFKMFNDIEPPMCASVGRPCSSPIIELTDFEAASPVTRALPTVLVIAGFHGNEVVGTNAIFQFLTGLETAYARLSRLQTFLRNARIVFLPMANVNGFDSLNREETRLGNSFDPNRDFPYDVSRIAGCFKTSTAEVIDRLFRRYLIVGTLTFHGGDNSITYPWGNFAHESNPVTGDNVAFSEIAKRLSQAAGDSTTHKIEAYKTGLLQDVVYDVNGGFEDWAYGASWDRPNVQADCGRQAPDDFKHVQYSSETNRALVFLVEAGYAKIPAEPTLGNRLAVFDPLDPRADPGHISRNVNLFLEFSRIVNPFLEFTQATTDSSGISLFRVALRGCVHIDSATTSLAQSTLKVEQTIPGSTDYEFVLSGQISDPKTSSIVFEARCDSGFTAHPADADPQTHFVRYRTDPAYFVQLGESELRGREKFALTLLNVDPRRLGEALAHHEPNGFATLAYGTPKLVVRVGTQPRFLLVTSQGKLRLASTQTEEPLEGPSFDVFQFVGSDKGTPILRSAALAPAYSSQFLLSLIGRMTRISQNGEHMEGVLTPFDLTKGLMIPSAGVVFREVTDQDFTFVHLDPVDRFFKSFDLRVLVFSRHPNIAALLLDGRAWKMGLEETRQLESGPIYVLRGLISAAKPDDLLLLGSRGALLDSGNSVVKEFFLGRASPREDAYRDLLLISKISPGPAPGKKSTTQLVYFIIAVAVVLMLVWLILHYRKRKLDRQLEMQMRGGAVPEVSATDSI